MGIFKRLRDLTLASIHDAFDKAEDPLMMLNQYLRDMETAIGEAEEATAKQIAAQKRLGFEMNQLENKIKLREQQAVTESIGNGSRRLSKTHVTT